MPGGAFRGFGGPQGAFVAESQMNKLASKLGMDPMELRQRNALTDLSDGITQSGLPEGVGVTRVIDACVERVPPSEELPEYPPFSPIASLPAKAEQLRQGRGYAVGMKNVGFSFGFPEACEADVVFHGDADEERPNRVELFHSAAEVGQVFRTAANKWQLRSRLDFESVDGFFSDTSTGGDSGSTSASRLTFIAGNSVLGDRRGRKSLGNGQDPQQGISAINRDARRWTRRPERGKTFTTATWPKQSS